MKNPSQATRTTPPTVEYVAVGREGAWVVGGVVAGGPAATVVVGAGGGLGAGWVVGGAGAGAFRGTVVRGRVVDVGGLVVVVVGRGSGGLDCSSLTTSLWGTTGAGRSVTSAATVEVAVQTMAVDTMVTTSQSPAASIRGVVIAPGCRLPRPRRAKRSLRTAPTPVTSLGMGSLYVGGQWCPECGAEYRPGFVECSDCHVPLSGVKPSPSRPAVDDDVDHAQLVYALGAWEEDQRRALELLLIGEHVPHGWDGSNLVVPHRREPEVDELIAAIEDAEPLEASAAAAVPAPAGGEEPDDGRPQVAGAGRRFVGFLLDSAVITVVALVIDRATSLPGLVVPVLIAAYEIVPVACWGRTLGKTIAGTRVVAVGDESIPGWRRATLRWAVVVGPTFATVWLRGGPGRLVDVVVVNAWMILVYRGVLDHPLRQGLHDRAAGTIVVEDLE